MPLSELSSNGSIFLNNRVKGKSKRGEQLKPDNVGTRGYPQLVFFSSSFPSSLKKLIQTVTTDLSLSLQQAMNHWSFFNNLNKQGFEEKRIPHGKYQAQPIFSIQRGSCKAGKRLHSSLQSSAAYLLQCKAHMLFTMMEKAFFGFTHTM